MLYLGEVASRDVSESHTQRRMEAQALLTITQLRKGSLPRGPLRDLSEWYGTSSDTLVRQGNVFPAYIGQQTEKLQCNLQCSGNAS